MESIKLKSRIGKDGILQVQLPDELRDQELEIMIILQPLSLLSQKESDQSNSLPESRGWNPGFFENVVGGWQGEPLQRPPQLSYETRAGLDSVGEG